MSSPLACDGNDCEEVKKWGIDSYKSDILYSAKRVQIETGKKPILLGYSMGAIIAMELMKDSSSAFSGVVQLDGTSYSADPKFKKPWKAQCENYRTMFSKGVIFSKQEAGMLKTIANLYLSDPDGISPFAGAMTNKSFLYFAFTSPVAGAHPNYHYAVGDHKSFKYTPVDLLVKTILTIKAEPLKISTDYSCLLGESKAKDYLNLAKVRFPILIISAEKGFSKFGQEAAPMYSRAPVTAIMRDSLGHADLLLTDIDKHSIKSDLLFWLNKYF